MRTTLFNSIFLIFALVFGPQAFAYQNVTNTPNGGCLQCHTFAGGSGAQHTAHTSASVSCDKCHAGGTPGKNVPSSACAECHPSGNPGACQIINTVTAHPKTGTNSCLSCHSNCAGSSGTGNCQEWVGSWQFTYDNTTTTRVCFDNTTLDNESLILCTTAGASCKCLDNITAEQLCIDTSTFEQCDNDTVDNCTCFDNPFFRALSIDPGTYAVVINNAQDNQTAGGLPFTCLATGVRTTDSKSISIGLPSPAAIDMSGRLLRNVVDNATFVVFEGSIQDNATTSFALVPQADFTGTSFTASQEYNFIGLASGTKEDNVTVECNLRVIPRTYSRLRALILSPVKPFFIRNDQAGKISFTRPIKNIDWGTDAINDIVRIQVTPRLIFGILIVRPFRLETGTYAVTVSYGDNETACGNIEVR